MTCNYSSKNEMQHPTLDCRFDWFATACANGGTGERGQGKKKGGRQTSARRCSRVIFSSSRARICRASCALLSSRLSVPAPRAPKANSNTTHGERGEACPALVVAF